MKTGRLTLEAFWDDLFGQATGVLGWPPSVALTTPIAEIELALAARYRFQRRQFRSLAGLLGMEVKAPPEEVSPPIDPAAEAQRLKAFFQSLAKKG